MSGSLSYLSKPLQCRVAACLLAAGMVVASTVSRADDLQPPVLTLENAAQLVGQAALVEATVVEVKFAERRQIHFLSAKANFRSEDNLPVAIRAADIGPFRQAGIKDLSAHYLGKKIRARGTVLRDEGQWLLVVASPQQIEVLDAAEQAAPEAELVIVNEQGKRFVHALPLSSELPRSKVTVDREGKPEVYEGVLLAELLKRDEVVLGAEARGSLLGRYLVVSAQDKYAATFSLAEIDPFFAERPALLAERVNGESLPANRVPLQVVVPGDKHRRRWVGQVITIEVRNALDKPAAGKP